MLSLADQSALDLFTAAIDELWDGPYSGEAYQGVLRRMATIITSMLEGMATCDEVAAALVFFEQVSKQALAATGSPGCGSGERTNWNARFVERRGRAEQLATSLIGYEQGDIDGLLAGAAVITNSAVSEAIEAGVQTLDYFAALALAGARYARRLPEVLRVKDTRGAIEVLEEAGGVYEVLAGLAAGWSGGVTELAEAARVLSVEEGAT